MSAGKKFIAEAVTSVCILFMAGRGRSIESPIEINVIDRMLEEGLKLKDCEISPINVIKKRALDMMGLKTVDERICRRDGKIIEIHICLRLTDARKVRVCFIGRETGRMFVDPWIFGMLTTGVVKNRNKIPSDFINEKVFEAVEQYKRGVGKTLQDPIKLGIVDAMIDKKFKLQDHCCVPWVTIERLTLKMLGLSYVDSCPTYCSGRYGTIYNCKSLHESSAETTDIYFDQNDCHDVFANMDKFLILTE